MDNLEQQKEVVAKTVCLYVADQIKENRLKMLDVGKLMNFLISGVEGAGSMEDLKKLPEEVKSLWPNLPSFGLNI